MNRLSSKKQVSQYLGIIRGCIDSHLYICHREEDPDKNFDFMRSEGFTSHDVKEVLKSLEVKDYSIGPCDSDIDLPNRHDVWKLGRTVSLDGKTFELYIKVAVGEMDDALCCICVSFHPCERPIKYPYR